MLALGTVPDLLRLLVVPILGWAAWRDVQTRRVPNRTWYPMVALGVVLLAWELAGHLPPSTFQDRRYLLRVALSVGLVAPLSYVFWRIGGFGGADAKALMALALVAPTFPTYHLPSTALPIVETALGVFSMTVLTNTVLVGLAYPLALAARNALDGDVSTVMFLGRRVAVPELATAHGRLFEDGDGFTRRGLDIDALRMYLRWRGTTLAAIRDDPERYRDPETIGATHDPGDGAVQDVRPDGGDGAGATGVANDARGETDADATTTDDPWGAAAFLEAVDGSAYGTDPELLRDGLDLVTARDEVWISPGVPFLVPMFVGIVLAFTYGDVLFGLLGALGLV
jgi:preflagellin peptidase FlaK